MEGFGEGLGTSGGDRWGGKKRRDYVRIAKFVIIGGFIVVGVIVLYVFLTTSGVNIEISEQNQMAGIQTINVRISNNQFSTLRVRLIWRPRKNSEGRKYGPVLVCGDYT